MGFSFTPADKEIFVVQPSVKNAACTLSKDGATLECTGSWNLAGIDEVQAKHKAIIKQARGIKFINGKGITHMDTIGAMQLLSIFHGIQKKNQQAKISGLDEQHQKFLTLIEKDSKKIQQEMSPEQPQGLLYQVGVWSVDKYEQTIDFLAFVGELAIAFYHTILNPRHFKWRSIVAAVESTGFYAVPIVSLMLFLIGVVLAYQLATQLEIYGADIYVVDVTGIGILREFAPLITAIIVAGRTSTSFAALIGSMKINEELDAMQTMGLSPMQWLVLPRIIGLIIALPLLTVLGDICGVYGSMVMTKHMLNIGFRAFLERFEYAVEAKHYVLGLVKTPVFALIIAAVGCFQGFQVTISAESVGQKTTKAAVQAIFLIILADAAFSILFNKMGY